MSVVAVVPSAKRARSRSWVPAGKAFVVVVLFRALTFYLHVVIGLCYLPFAGGVRQILLSRSTQR